MKKVLVMLLGLMLAFGARAQEQFVNLTPRPKSICVGTGVWTLPATVTVGTGQLAAEYVAEAEKFAAVLQTATGRKVSVTASTSADIVLKVNSTIKNAEGYKLTVKTDGVTAEAGTATGFFYALQTLKKIMPANVMAGVYDAKVESYTAPVCIINDEPRFEYRGFMLDVSRHFFDVAQVKRMLDVMAYYKLNKFHWHLSDDQGWRIEIKKYPKLTTVGATRDFSWEVDPVYGRYQTYEPYGPFFYTQEEAKEVVEYAEKLHIEVIPEIDMPGHFVAAMTAYPEYSCTPNGAHNVWTDGGISSDVMNVANPKAVQFTKDIITELAAIFPSKHFHIGGDECPTTAWENNAECKALYKELGLTSYRALQSHFIKQIDEHVKSLGKHLFMWNESISASGADQTIIQNTDATIMCWTGPYAAASTATQRGLKVIITPWGPYYINRVQSKDPGEPVGAGDGSDTAERTYNEKPVPDNVPDNLRPLYIGVQGTFWCEHVGSRYLLEYLALPRLICVAEAGWTPQEKKDWSDFKKRWNQDYKILDYNGYYYGKHFLENDSCSGKVMPEAGAYYRVVTTATDAARKDACVEVLPEGSSKIGTGNAKALRLWQMPQVTDPTSSEYDYQWFTFELDPQGSGLYAMVCKAMPEGSVNPTPTASNNTARWDYDKTTKHYAWSLGDHTYGRLDNGNYKYTIHSNKQPSNMYMNAAAGGQQYSVNQWSDPADGNGGIWEFAPADGGAPEPEPEKYDTPWVAEGSIVRIENAVKTGIMLYADESGTLKNSTDRFTANAWQIMKYGEESASGLSRTVQLKNVATGKSISNVGVTPVTVGSAAADIILTYDTVNVCWNIGGMIPIGANYATNPGCVTKDGVYPQGAGWKMTVATPVHIECVDKTGKALGEYHSSLAEGETIGAENMPVMKNHKFVEYSKLEDKAGDATMYVKAVYEREAYSVTLRGVDGRGIILYDAEKTVAVGESYTVAWPAYDFGILYQAEKEEGTVLELTEDVTLKGVYMTDGLMGFKAVGERVEKVEKNMAYLIYNAMPTDASRTGFLHTQGGNALWLVRGAQSGDPSYVWTANASGTMYKFGNEMGLWIGTMLRGTNMTAVESKTSADLFTLSRNSDGTFYVKGTNYYWNANAGGGFTGWDNGHPYAFYTLYGHPYFYVTVTTTYYDGMSEISSETVTTLVSGGSDASGLVSAPEVEGYDAAEIEGAEGIGYVKSNLDVNVVYKKTVPSGVTSVRGEAASTEMYDLSGRKVSRQQRGVMIRGGKKVVK